MRPLSHYLAFLDTRIEKQDCAALAHMALDRLLDGAGARGITLPSVEAHECPTEESAIGARLVVTLDGQRYLVRVDIAD